MITITDDSGVTFYQGRCRNPTQGRFQFASTIRLLSLVYAVRGRLHVDGLDADTLPAYII